MEAPKKQREILTIFLWILAWLVLAIAPIARGADITPGHTFVSGEQNITHTVLNNALAGTINTSFITGKGSAGANPSQDFYILLYDNVTDAYKRSSLRVGVFDHSSLLTGRTAKTAPVALDYLFLGDSEAGDAYKRISITNLFMGGAATGPITNETRISALLGGALGSFSLSNLVGALTAHTLTTNGDALLVLTENGRAIKQTTLSSVFTGYVAGTNFSGDHLIVSYDGTRLRANRATNLIDGLTVTNTTPTSNDVFVSLQAGQLKKTAFGAIKSVMGAANMAQSVFLRQTNIAGSSGNWSNVTALGSHSLSNSITPTASSSKILVRLVLHACANGNSQPGAVRLMRNGSGIGVGGDFVSSGNRTEASAAIPQSSDPQTVVAEWLDSPSTTLAVNYYIEVKATTSTTIYINRTSGDADNENNFRLASTLTLQEILQ